MLTLTAMLTKFKNILNKDKSYAYQLFLEELIERKKYGLNTSPYRIKNLDNNSYITSLTEFVNNISEISTRFNFSSPNKASDGVSQSFVLTIENYLVELINTEEEDQTFTILFGNGNKKISFILTYLPDSDPDIFTLWSVRLITP